MRRPLAVALILAAFAPGCGGVSEEPAPPPESPRVVVAEKKVSAVRKRARARPQPRVYRVPEPSLETATD